MANIKIEDLKLDEKVGKEEMKRITGGLSTTKLGSRSIFIPTTNSFTRFKPIITDAEWNDGAGCGAVGGRG